MTNNTDPVRALADLAERAVPFLRDEAAKYDDDGSNEPLELAREIETALASLPSDESALSSANSAFDGGREAALTSAPPSAPVGVERKELIRAARSLRKAERAIGRVLAQQPAAPSGEAVARVNFIGAVASVEWLAPNLVATVRHGTKLYTAPQQPAGVDGLANLAAAVRQHLRWRETGVSRVPCIAELREWADAFDALAAQQQGGAE